MFLINFSTANDLLQEQVVTEKSVENRKESFYVREHG